jgi:hypothetical protein
MSRGDDRRRDRVDGVDAEGVLHGHGGDGARRIAAQRGDGLDVGLHARPATGIGAGDGEHAAHAPCHGR